LEDGILLEVAFLLEVGVAPAELASDWASPQPAKTKAAATAIREKIFFFIEFLSFYSLSN
jgi:hypothetical protein